MGTNNNQRFEVTLAYEGRARFLVDAETPSMARDFIEVYGDDLLAEGKAFEQIESKFRVIHVGYAPRANDDVVLVEWPDDADAPSEGEQ